MPVRIAVNGAAGRMGRRLMALAAADAELDLVQALEMEGHDLIGRPVREFEPQARGEARLLSALESGAEALIDFSAPAGAAARAAEAARLGTALIIGTTGLGPSEEEAIDRAARSVPVILAPNFSLGVNLVFRVAAEIARALGEGFDIEISESHHNKKADAPSGTALGIARSICAALGRDPAAALVHGRSGKPGARPRDEIGMHALRLGSIVGDHTVFFASEFERIELTHRAQTRDVFAAGALRAAKWIAGRAAGRYCMGDVLWG